MSVMPRHQCLLYQGAPSTHLPALAVMIRLKLKENHRCLYLNSVPMVVGLRSYLYAGGVDVPKEIMKGSLVLSSATGHLVNGSFSTERMLGLLNDAAEQAQRDGYRGLLATGDVSWEFGPERDFSKLLEYEWRLEELFRKHQTMLGICQYHLDMLPPEAVGHGLLSHPGLFINETLSRLNPDYSITNS